MEAKKSYIFYAEGVEEIEAVGTVDALRRGGVEVVAVSVTGNVIVNGATRQRLVADCLLGEIDPADAEWLIIPGGAPGAWSLHDVVELNDIIRAHWAQGGKVAAICAGPPIVLAPTGILRGRTVTCYPDLAKDLSPAGAVYVKQPVVIDGRLISSEGPSTTLLFAGAIISATTGPEKANDTMECLLVSV